MSTESIFRYGKTPGAGALEANFALVKATVDCYQVASYESNLWREGERWRGPCPLPEHQGKSPSFYVFPNDGGFYDKWYCHHCQTGGDVIDLYGRMHELGEHNPVGVMRTLAEQEGVKLWSDEDVMSDAEIIAARAQRNAEKRIEQMYVERHFREHVIPEIKKIEDHGERLEALEEALKDAGLG